MNSNERVLPFAFIGEKRGWLAPDGRQLSDAPVWDVYCLPGRMWASGASFDEASRMLQNMIDGAMQRFGDDGKWYDCMKSKMKPDDLNMMMSVFIRCFDRQKKFSEELRMRRRQREEQQEADLAFFPALENVAAPDNCELEAAGR